MIASDELRELYRDAGLTRRQAAAFLGRTDRQFRRWLQYGAPDWAGTMLRMRAGWLDQYGWPGWRIREGRLWCIHWREGFTPADLFAWHWQRQKLLGYDRASGINDRGNEEGNPMK